MLVYRVLPDKFVLNKRLDENNQHGFESIFYEAGYTSFSGKNPKTLYNNYRNKIEGEGKFLYLFPEDALNEATKLTGNFHKIYTETPVVVEYDIPNDYVLESIGYGDYSYGIQERYYIESFIKKELFGDTIINSQDLDKDLLLDMLSKSFNESLKRMKTCMSFRDIMYYCEHFKGKKIQELIDNMDEIKDVLSSSTLYKIFLDLSLDLIKSPYITGKVVPVNVSFWSYALNSLENIKKFYQEYGIEPDFSDEIEDKKNDIVSCLREDNINMDDVKKLINTIK